MQILTVRELWAKTREIQTHDHDSQVSRVMFSRPYSYLPHTTGAEIPGAHGSDGESPSIGGGDVLARKFATTW
jgi:hypothetical protein